MGRSTKLTPEVQRKIVAAVESGNYFEVACVNAGVAVNTGYEWLARGEGKNPKGRQGNETYANFANAVRVAEAAAEDRAVEIITRSFPEDPKLALEFLARRHPERWGRRDTLTVLQRLAGKVQAMSDDELIAVISSAGSGGDLPEDGGGRTPPPGPERNGRH